MKRIISVIFSTPEERDTSCPSSVFTFQYIALDVQRLIESWSSKVWSCSCVREDLPFTIPTLCSATVCFISGSSDRQSEYEVDSGLPSVSHSNCTAVSGLSSAKAISVISSGCNNLVDIRFTWIVCTSDAAAVVLPVSLTVQYNSASWPAFIPNWEKYWSAANTDKVKEVDLPASIFTGFLKSLVAQRISLAPFSNALSHEKLYSSIDKSFKSIFVPSWGALR